MEETMTIGKVAGQASVNIQTIRFYERRGLLNPDDRSESGYRIYNREAVKKVQFIKNAQGLGFTLDEIEELLRLRVSTRSRCGTVKKKAQIKMRHVENKIKQLQAMKNALNSLIQACRSRRPTRECPILRAFEGS